MTTTTLSDPHSVPPHDATAIRPVLPLRARRTMRLLIVCGLAGSFSALVVLMLRAGLTVDPFGQGSIPLITAAALALAIRLSARRLRWRHARAIGDCAEFYGIFFGMALMGAVASYPIAATTHGYADPVLQAIDAALHFDWLAWYRATAASPMLQFLGTVAYRSIYLSPALLLAYYAGTAQRAEAYRFIITFWLSAIITLSLYRFMPAIGPFSYLWHGPIPYMPESELWQPDLIPRLRAHSVHVVDLGHLRGIVSAPSFHAAAATLYVGAAWRVRRLRWPLLGVNAAMLLSTPVEGTHYLADILLGIAVASLALAIVHVVVAKVARAPT